MLFNSVEFITWFLPIALAVFFILGKWASRRLAILWLVLASLFFYGWWSPDYVLILLCSIPFNYWIGLRLIEQKRRGHLILGILVNLGVLAYFKYSFFFLENLNLALGTNFWIGAILLPLGISFFTFQQITYLVDAYKGITEEHDFLGYCLFVTFFPQLIAGPIVHHKEMLPQFGLSSTFTPRVENLMVGGTIFAIGLFKKVVIADQIAALSTPVFSAAAIGEPLTFFEAWSGALAFTMQLYFDFSGYSDMAIGLGRMFGIRLPINFNSPYKATNIIDFWRRWHMTLSRFLRDYVYIPLGGNRHGSTRRYTNLMITMLLGGLWHGAGWTFIVWGALHGFYLLVNHAWREATAALGRDLTKHTRYGPAFARLLTFLAVVVAWVFFRAESFSAASEVIHGMAGLNGIALPLRLEPHLDWLAAAAPHLVSFEPMRYFRLIHFVPFALLFSIIWLLPNTQEWLAKFVTATPSETPELQAPARDQRPLAWHQRLQSWQPGTLHGVLMGAVLTVTLLGVLSDAPSEFLYFNF